MHADRRHRRIVKVYEYSTPIIMRKLVRFMVLPHLLDSSSVTVMVLQFE